MIGNSVDPESPVWALIAQVAESSAWVYLQGCEVGGKDTMSNGQDYVNKLAKQMGLTVVAYTGPTDYNINPVFNTPYRTWLFGGPHYSNNGVPVIGRPSR